VKILRLLTVSERELERFEPYFEEVKNIDPSSVAPEVIDGETGVMTGDSYIEEFDAAYLEMPVKNAVFGRVTLETVEEKNIPVNISSTGFFMSAKKNYLYYNLHSMDLPAPKTAVVASEEGARNLDKELRGPLVGRKFEELEETESKKLETVDSIYDFADGTSYGDDLLIFHEYSDGKKFRCLVIGDKIISVLDDSDSWEHSQENLKYSNISDKQRETVQKAVNKIGTPMAEVLLRGEQIWDINPNPDLEKYTEVSGKNAFETVSKMLKERGK
jgi:glutathione synthase/RimK-type ligase-like ATP-grasp enzyme